MKGRSPASAWRSKPPLRCPASDPPDFEGCPCRGQTPAVGTTGGQTPVVQFPTRAALAEWTLAVRTCLGLLRIACITPRAQPETLPDGQSHGSETGRAPQAQLSGSRSVS